MSDLTFRIHYLARRALLTMLGPARLDNWRDPIVQLDRERDRRLGQRHHRVPKVYHPRRQFSAERREANRIS